MPETWICLTIGAALLQSIRTAGQKQLTASLSVMAGTYVRSFLGLPVMLVYLGLLKLLSGAPWPVFTARFALFALLTALTQMAASMALLTLYRHRNFAVANQLGKTDMIFTAVLGTAIFGQFLSGPGWLALALTGLGVALLMTAKTGTDGLGTLSVAGLARDPAVRAGLFVGLMFGICNLTLREATLSLPGGSRVMAGALTVTCVTAIQAVLMATGLSVREPGAHRAIAANLRLAGFVGVTSALGSIAWFTAFAIESAAHVRIVGQIEVVFTVLISHLYFRERITAQEALGMALTIAGIVLVQAVG
jgi:drug/metabolite transporter (DMT)-like permease